MLLLLRRQLVRVLLLLHREIVRVLRAHLVPLRARLMRQLRRRAVLFGRERQPFDLRLVVADDTLRERVDLGDGNGGRIAHLLKLNVLLG